MSNLDPRPSLRKQEVTVEQIDARFEVQISNFDELNRHLCTQKYGGFGATLHGVGLSSTPKGFSLNDLEIELEGDYLSASSSLHPRYAHVLHHLQEDLNLQIFALNGEGWVIKKPEGPVSEAEFGNEVSNQALELLRQQLDETALPPCNGAMTLQVFRRTTVEGQEADEHVANLNVVHAGFATIDYRTTLTTCRDPKIMEQEINYFVNLHRALFRAFHKADKTLPPKDKLHISPETNEHFSTKYRNTTPTPPLGVQHPAGASLNQLIEAKLEQLKVEARNPEMRDIALAEMKTLARRLNAALKDTRAAYREVEDKK